MIDLFYFKLISFNFLKNQKKLYLSIKGPLGFAVLNSKNAIYCLNRFIFFKTLNLQTINLLNNILYTFIKGVCYGYKKTLEIFGHNYKYNILHDGILEAKLGFSHIVIFKYNTFTYNLKTAKKNQLKIWSNNYYKLYNIIKVITLLKKPKPYVKKGIYLKGLILNLKTGKKKYV